MSKRMFFDQCVLVCDNLASVATTLQTSFPHLAHESAAMLRAAGPSWTLLTLLEWCTAVVVTETFVECSDERIELLRTQLRRLTIATDFVHMATEVALSLRAHGRACRPYGEAFAAHCAASACSNSHFGICELVRAMCAWFSRSMVHVRHLL
mmetsp:Transcript_10377/g.23146  ORF Transcript_10377/g.23146 Transcript_10377/m.23146 type:complete len:152 (-) Transcript_10377:67-522(-)|eukprot:CAMPEP_0184393486 /NCGR_PEP_ID=MMETSP0007-20130409/34764_1 /TAXON_ID=97485 /ORGANISM="Prymnesium parvum, Strain Texoma1" /LENGTH=151 /DNA_ID=CAMNT_0026744499 /DNA_START=27 /DNA_END=482 /DNA_ORIENTATION=+